MCSPPVSWAKLVPLHPGPQEPACAGVPRPSWQEESLGAGYACPVDKGTAPNPDNPIQLALETSLGDHVCDSAWPQTVGAAGLPGARRDPGVALQRPLYTNLLVELPTWL